ncbi:MAG TPA: hypothetical protein VKX17_23245 [Planctomycetota bacterium]|nr:hypothetical protein [Planctomycetota bacterium]
MTKRFQFSLAELLLLVMFSGGSGVLILRRWPALDGVALTASIVLILIVTLISWIAGLVICADCKIERAGARTMVLAGFMAFLLGLFMAPSFLN